MIMTSWKCRVHDLDYEYYNDWDSRNNGPPGCPVCLRKELQLCQKQCEKLKQDYELILSAITLKTQQEQVEPKDEH